MNQSPDARRRRLAMLVLTSSALVAAALWVGDRYTSVWLATGIAASISIALCVWMDGSHLRDLLRPTRRSLWIGLVAGLLMAAGTYALYAIAAFVVPGLHEEVGGLYKTLHDPPGVAFALPVLFVVILSEELVWRGALFDALPSTVSRERAVLLSALVYALPQVGKGSLVLVLVAFVCGVFWGAERVWTRGLVAPLVTHVMWDLLLFVVAPLK